MPKKFLSVLVLLCAAVFGAFAQSADSRYVSRMTQDGTLFFIMPHKLGNTEGIKKFDYDVTLLSWTDSITVNFTFRSPEMVAPTDLRICSGNKEYVCNKYSPLFIDIKKNEYEIRITSMFLASEFKAMIDNPSPLEFRFEQNGKQKSAAYKIGAWRKDAKKLQDIFKLYEYMK